MFGVVRSWCTGATGNQTFRMLKDFIEHLFWFILPLMIRTVRGLFNFTLVMVIALALTIPASPVNESNDTETHLNEFSKYTIVHHDNIDDTAEAHSHVHKHSDDGEEHEHDHEHSRVVESTSKTLFSSIVPSLSLTEIESSPGFSEKKFISNPHPFGIFRPPRV